MLSEYQTTLHLEPQTMQNLKQKFRSKPPSEKWGFLPKMY
jgi:hypothetical protein